MLPTHPTSTDTAVKINYLIDMMKAEFATPTDDCIFRVLPVGTSQDYTYIISQLIGVHLVGSVWEYLLEDKEVSMKFILNGFNTESRYYLPEYMAPFEINGFMGEFTQKIKNDKSIIDLPLGYGMSPFLKVSAALSIIFSGYTIDFSELLTNYDLFDTDCIINNVADAICAGKMDFSKLLPDVTVKEFIDYCETRYAGKFIVDEKSKMVKFYSYDWVASDPDIDLSSYLSSKPKQLSTEFEKVKVVYSTDNKVTESSKIKVSEINIDVQLLTIAKINKLFMVDDVDQTIYPDYLDSFVYLNLDLFLIDAGSIVHKYTNDIIDGKEVSEDRTSSNTIIFYSGYFRNAIFQRYLPEGGTDKFMTAIPTGAFYGDKINNQPLPPIKTLYNKYVDFKLNSNIPLTATMNIPEPILNSLNLQSPKLLNNQPVMIESLKYAFGKQGSQTVNFRTLRQYADR